MALKSNFNESRFDQDVKRQKETIDEKILDSFINAGERFIIDAREQGQSHEAGQYQDETANLRNSISYYIFKDGQLIIGGKPGNYSGKVSEGKLSAAEIEAIDKSVIQSVISEKGFQLIVVAGMNYASYVESKGYNVISYQADVCLINLEHNLLKVGVIERERIIETEESFLP